MSDCDSSDSLSVSLTEGEMQREEAKDMKEKGRTTPSLYKFSATIRAVIRIKQKYLAIKKRRMELAAVQDIDAAPVATQDRISPKFFTFDGLTPYSSYPTLNSTFHLKKRKLTKRRVMFPTGGRRKAPPKQGQSRAKYCLYLLLAIVCLQVYNAIENLDDHVVRYDLEGLERTLRREVFGQQGAVEDLLAHMKDYLSTYVHNKPLVLSIHGPSGVGKSHLGRVLAGHFRSIVGEDLVLQYYVLHHCPDEAEALHCAQALSELITEKVARAEEEEKIPLFIFDEAEHLHSELLDALRELVVSKRSNEYLNAIYLLFSNLGHAHITKHLMHNSSSVAMSIPTARRYGNLVRELTPILRGTLEKLHPLWTEADLLTMGLLDKSHVMSCFLEEMTREGFYPDRVNIERLAGEIEYYPAVGAIEYARTGCKQVVAKVNML